MRMRVVALAAGLLSLMGTGAYADPVPSGPGYPFVPKYIGHAATARPLPGRAVPGNPYMAAPGYGGMHADSYASDTYPFGGPLGRTPVVRSEAKAPTPVPGLCSTVTYARSTRLIVAQCVSGLTFRLRLIDPATLTDLATYDLPLRPSMISAIGSLDLDKILSDTSGGAYLYLDAQDRAVLADAAFHVRRFAHRSVGGHWRFVVTDDWDLSRYLPHSCPTWTNPKPAGECDPITGVAPDFTGRIWWASRNGRIGTLDPRTGTVRLLDTHEEIENSFAAAENGVSIVTDHALYQLRAAPDGTPRVVWRRAYDRGSARKPGQIDQGSGTTPTFLGSKYVAITDNADDRMHVLVYRRDTGQRVCAVPVFGHGQSATENSLVGFGSSLYVENNYGYLSYLKLPLGGSSVGGVSRVDVTSQGCRTVWRSKERSLSVVPKLSVASGLLYLYTKEPRRDLIDAWYLTAVDARTGHTVYKVLTGTGKTYDNDWAPITLGPDGTAYVGVTGGLVAVHDR